MTFASFASIKDDVNDDKDEDILSIDDANADFEDIAIVLPPLRHFPIWVWECPLLPPNLLLASELATLPPQRWHADLNGLVSALVVETNFRRPTTQTRPFPPTLNQ